MASITSLMGGTSSSSSLYGTRNVISGLASGMDTEAMIENAVSGYNMKIANLKQDYTMLEWQQNAFRSIISKMNNFSNKYLSYTSSTNLLSQSFFNNAVNVKSLGEHASKVTATGKTTSDVKVLGVKQLATAASYSVEGVGTKADRTPTIKGEAVALSDKYETSNVSGTLRIKYGNKAFTVKLGADELVKDGQELADLINEKLGEQEMALNNGQVVKVNTRIQARYNEADGSITMVDAAGAGNAVWISGASGSIRDTLGITPSSTSYKESAKSFTVGGKDLINDEKTNAQHLSEQSITFNLDGASKSITLSGVEDSWTMDQVADALKTELEDAFGAGKIDVTVDAQTGGLKLTAQKGSTLTISNGKALGLASDSETTNISTNSTLGSLLEDDDFAALAGSRVAAVGDSSQFQEVTKGGETYYVDEKGNRVAEGEDGNWYRTDSKGEYLYNFEINGKSVGSFSKNSTLKNVMDAINSSGAGVTVSYSATTNRFHFASKTTGVSSEINMGDGLAKTLFGDPGNVDPDSEVASYTKGQDAVLTLSVNGMAFETTRTTNSFDVDGLNIKLNGTFNYETDTRVEVADGIYKAATFGGDNSVTLVNGSSGETVKLDYSYVNEKGQYVLEDGTTYEDVLKGLPYTLSGVPTTGEFWHQDAQGNQITDAAMQKTGSLVAGAEAVTFDIETNADTIVDAIKDFVKDYNEMATEIKSAYSTMPQYNSSGDRYEPLTDDDKADMTESAINDYEEKAKQGILFADRDLNNLYNEMTNTFNSAGSALKAIGINITYEDGTTTLSLDETKLRSVLESDPEKVRDALAGDGTKDGALQKMENTLKKYGEVTGENKGILVDKAGTPLSARSLLSNQLLTQMDNINEQIERWQDKLSDQVDYYTRQFTALEQLILEMNSQSSALMGLMG